MDYKCFQIIRISDEFFKIWNRINCYVRRFFRDETITGVFAITNRTCKSVNNIRFRLFDIRHNPKGT
jgi:hypothetical protein